MGMFLLRGLGSGLSRPNLWKSQIFKVKVYDVPNLRSPVLLVQMSFQQLASASHDPECEIINRNDMKAKCVGLFKVLKWWYVIVE